MIAEHMVMSKRTSTHVHTFAEVDMHKVVAFRAGKKKEGVSLTYLPFVIWAAIEAIREFPVLNAQVVGETTVIRKAIHIGVAVDTERGLIVPVIRNAHEKSLLGLAKAPGVGEKGGEGAIVIRPMMFLCLGYDHRVIDGVTGNSFLFRVREILEAGGCPL